MVVFVRFCAGFWEVSEGGAREGTTAPRTASRGTGIKVWGCLGERF